MPTAAERAFLTQLERIKFSSTMPQVPPPQQTLAQLPHFAATGIRSAETLTQRGSREDSCLL